MTQPITKAERIAAAEAILRAHLQKGNLLTHTRCMGCIEEHIYTQRDGIFLCGTPTKDTVKFGGSNFPINDIHPLNVTHINRVPIEVVPMLADIKKKAKP